MQLTFIQLSSHHCVSQGASVLLYCTVSDCVHPGVFPPLFFHEVIMSYSQRFCRTIEEIENSWHRAIVEYVISGAVLEVMTR